MKYEKPDMKVEKFEEESIIYTSIGQGGTSTEVEGPEIDWNL